METINLDMLQKTILAFLDNLKETDYTPEKIAETIYTYFKSNPELADDEAFLINIATKNLDVFSELIEPIYTLNPTVVGNTAFYERLPDTSVIGKVNIIYQAAKRDKFQKGMNAGFLEEDNLKKKILEFVSFNKTLRNIILTPEEDNVKKRICINVSFVLQLLKHADVNEVLEFLTDFSKNQPEVWLSLFRGSNLILEDFLDLPIPKTVTSNKMFWTSLFNYTSLTTDQLCDLLTDTNADVTFSDKELDGMNINREKYKSVYSR